MKFTAKFRKTPPPQAFFQLYDEEDAVWGLRPACLAEPQGPQAGIQRHTMEHIADVMPMVQILDIPALLGADQLVEVGRHLDLHVPEQAIEVPKISSTPRHPRRRFLFPVRMAEQLVEVPTIISYSMLRTIEQTMDIPVPRVRGGRGGGLQGFHPGQGIPAAGVEQNVEIPVSQRRRNKIGGFQGFFPGQNSTADVEQNVDIPARGGLHGFLPGQGSSSSSRFPGGADEGIQGGFRTFSRKKKSAKRSPHSGSELGADFTSTLSAHQMPPEQLVDVPVPLSAPLGAQSSSWTPTDYELTHLVREDGEDDSNWFTDEIGRSWVRLGPIPGRWYLTGNRASGVIFWDEDT